MAETPQFLSDRLRSEGQKMVLFFEQLTPAQWDRVVYSEGETWSVREILAHFVATEASLSKLVANIAGGGPGTPEGFDIDRYNARKIASLKDTSIEDLRRQYAVLREQTASQVSALSLADLDRRGRHPFLGVTSLVEIIKLIYRHNQIHHRDVRKALVQAN